MAVLQITYAGHNYFADGDRTTLRHFLAAIRLGAENQGRWVDLPGEESDAALFVSPGVPMTATITEPDDEVRTVTDLLKSEPSKPPRRLT